MEIASSGWHKIHQPIYDSKLPSPNQPTSLRSWNARGLNHSIPLNWATKHNCLSTLLPKGKVTCVQDTHTKPEDLPYLPKYSEDHRASVYCTHESPARGGLATFFQHSFTRNTVRVYCSSILHNRAQIPLITTPTHHYQIINLYLDPGTPNPG